ncbi:MAG: hypothetical protein R3342_10620 [Lutibacter sp.]|uniref:hypothetical protein n=1 Tax=Lutibacter sp. TaxID=1925666 RepID=UPI00299E1405|nr:hypothetical protein [Lutibacter sp.]MDX1829986.1 hypothetical protein [Lutibacter sp.]
MKKIMKYFLFIAIISVYLVACDKNETVYNPLNYDTDSFIALAKSEGVITENNTGAYNVVALLGTTSHTSEVSIDFSISSTFVEGVDYEVLDGKTSFSFAPGVYSDTLKIKPINNAISDGDKLITVNLGTPSNTFNVGYPGPTNTLGKYTNVTIIDDDCPLDISTFVGTYSANEEGYCDGCYEIDAVLGPDPNTIILSNLWDSGFVATATLNNDDPDNPILTWTDGEYVSDSYGGTYIYNWAAYGYSSPISSFRTCDNYMNLNGIFDLTLYGGYSFHIQLTKK